MTRSVTTERILAEKAMQQTCGQQCIDWAMGMLESGSDNEYLKRLAVMMPPHNHFEIADLRDQALRGLGFADVCLSDALQRYVKELLRSALDNQSNLVEAIGEAAHLCWTNDYIKELFDFYLLYDAYDDLISQGVQWSWEGATIENIDSLMRERAEQFVFSEAR